MVSISDFRGLSLSEGCRLELEVPTGVSKQILRSLVEGLLKRARHFWKEALACKSPLLGKLQRAQTRSPFILDSTIVALNIAKFALIQDLE